MKKGILVPAVVLLLMFGAFGCEEFLLGAGAGVAGQETLQDWKENLETRKTELAQQYEEVLAELKIAPDPNAAAFAKQKLNEVQNSQIANEAALFTVGELLKLPEYKEKTPAERKDALATGLVGLGILGLREWQKRKLNLKYVSMKAGKASFETAEPEAAKKLHTAIGIERTNRGL